MEIIYTAGVARDHISYIPVTLFPIQLVFIESVMGCPLFLLAAPDCLGIARTESAGKFKRLWPALDGVRVAIGPF